ncbi:MAG: hypothetical protein ACXVB4_18045, partial [Pseudobdellovibrionaceae bacterium]
GGRGARDLGESVEGKEYQEKECKDVHSVMLTPKYWNSNFQLFISLICDFFTGKKAPLNPA